MGSDQAEAMLLSIAPVVLITGEGDQGQNLVAMACVESAMQNGQMVLHNGCSSEGLRITDKALSSDDILAELMNFVREESVFILADADCIPALTSRPAEIRPKWLRACWDQGHMVILSTVRGREYRVLASISNEHTAHVHVEARHQGLGVFVTWASGKLWERFPLTRAFYIRETVDRWLVLTDGSYRSPDRPDSELIAPPPRSIVLPLDYTEAVQSAETPKPKHPSNSFLLTRICKLEPNRQVKITEIIGLPWLESVNKARDEEFAILTLGWACERWGIPLEQIDINPDTSYPDGWATSTRGRVNIEVTKVQPTWPSGATLADLAPAAREGKGPTPDRSPVIRCRECGTLSVPDVNDIHTLPEHDQTHAWICTYPKWMISPDYPENLTALPELFIDADLLRVSLDEAVAKKNDRARRYGAGEENWLLLLIEGFPPVGNVDSLLKAYDWGGLDAVFGVFTDEFGSAIQGNHPDDNRRMVVLKCPELGRHQCYHPGLVMVARKGGGNFDELRGQGKDRGITHQWTNSSGDVLAECDEEPPQPMSHDDLHKGLQAAANKLYSQQGYAVR